MTDADMTSAATDPSPVLAFAGASTADGTVRGRLPRDKRDSWVPTWDLISTKLLELRRRRGLMVVVLLLTIGLPFLVLGLRLVFHAVDPKSYGPAGSPGIFTDLSNPMAEFGFIAAAALGTTAGTTDLTDGVFRHLVITGRSRLALYLARIPAGLAIIVPLVALAFASLCLVTSFAGIPQPTSITENGISVPAHLSQAQLENWILQHPQQATTAFSNGRITVEGRSGGGVSFKPTTGPAITRANINSRIGTIYGRYVSDEASGLNPPTNEMVKIGAWIELNVIIGFMVGLGLGSLMGQRTVSTVLMIVLEILITPILANAIIPYFLNGQRLLVGVALDQLRPAGLGAVGQGGGHRILFGGHGVLGIPPMPTWAMVMVIVGWIVGWSVIGAWRMATRDA